MNVLVTGGAGYVGSHACKYLKRIGHNPITYDNLIYGHEWAVQWGPFYKGDIHDTQLLTEIMNKEKVQAVMHFAAYAYVGESVQQPEKYYFNNVVGSLSLLRAMQQAKVDKIIFSSSCATYGLAQEVPIRESSQQVPINPYGRTKKIVEEMLSDVANGEKPIHSFVLRYFNAAGADADLEIGEDHDPETHLIPLAIQSAYRGTELKIYGTDYDTADGTCIRDYIHVSDLAIAHAKALEYLLARKNNYTAMNLGGGRGFSVKEIVSAVEHVTGKKVRTFAAKRRAGDPPILIADISMAQRELGWQPEYQTIEKIVETASLWYQKKNKLGGIP